VRRAGKKRPSRATLPAVRISRALTAGAVAALVSFLAVPVASAATLIPAGRVTLLSDVSNPYPTLPAPKGDSRIRGYAFAAAVTGDECAATVGNGPDGLVAPAGDEVCDFSWSLAGFFPLSETDQGQEVPGLVGEVTDGSVNAAISANDLDDAGDAELAISVPRGSDAVLSLSAAGFSQSYSLTEQRRVGSAPPVLYRSPSSYEVDAYPGTKTSLTETGLSDHRTATMKVTLSELELTYFRPDDPLLSAPSPSEAFLAATFDTADEPGPSGSSFGNFLVPGANFSNVRLRLPGGEVVSSVVIGTPGSDVLDNTYVFVVPASFSRGSLLIDPGVVYGNETGTPGALPSEDVRFSNATIPIDGGVAGTPVTGANPTTGRPPSSFPLGIPIGGGATLLLLVIVVPIWRRNRRGRELVIVFPEATTGGSQPKESRAPDADDADAQACRQNELQDAAEAPVMAVEPGQTDVADEATLSRRLVVNLLGPVETIPSLRESGRTVLEPLAIYLILHAETEVTSDELCTALSTRAGPLKPATLASYVWNFRQHLGKDVLVSTKRSATYRYSGEIACDWADFEDFVRRARAASGDERLELLLAALSLVRGQPFGGDPRYDWAVEEFAIPMCGAIRRAAMEASEVLLGNKRNEEAARAVGIGILVDPDDFELHRQRLNCCAGDERAIEEAWADTARRLGNRAKPLRPLRDRLIGKVRFVREEEIAGS
jgi:hypothetical protein